MNFRLVPLVTFVVLAGCRADPKPAPQAVVIWRSLGSWSGHGNMQTESFTSDTGAFRMHWQTKNEASRGAGTFRLTLQSAISGRPLTVPVDEKGVGEGTAFVGEDPRIFYMVVDSADVDWSFSVEEALPGTQTSP